MLILSRYIGEAIKIGEDVTITILGVRGAHVRIGVNAPKSVPVHRQEVYERVHNRHLEETRARRTDEEPPAPVAATG